MAVGTRTQVVYPGRTPATGGTVGVGLRHVIAVFGATVLSPILRGRGRSRLASHLSSRQGIESIASGDAVPVVVLRRPEVRICVGSRNFAEV